MTWGNQGAGERIRAELALDPGRSDAEIAAAARCGVSTVARHRGSFAPPDPSERARTRALDRAYAGTPAQPDLSSGRCVTHPGGADLWASRDREDQQAALFLCQACPCLAECRSWALSLPPSPGVIIGGLTPYQLAQARTQALREQAEQQARAQATRARRAKSERLRYALGKGNTPEAARQRYLADPEPAKARARAYYQANKTEILASRHAARRAVG